MDDRFLSAFTEPTREKILGRFVYPFCLKYRVRLCAIGSPLMTPNAEVQPIDLIIAMQICAEETIGKKLGWFDRYRLKKMQKDRIYFLETYQKFIDYVQIKNQPKFWERNKKSDSAGAGVPWELMVIANLMQAGVQEERAWHMPECQAIWLNSAIMTTKGVELNVLSTEEEEFLESQKQPTENQNL